MRQYELPLRKAKSRTIGMRDSDSGSVVPLAASLGASFTDNVSEIRERSDVKDFGEAAEREAILCRALDRRSCTMPGMLSYGRGQRRWR